MIAKVILTGDIIDVTPRSNSNPGDKVYYGGKPDFANTEDSSIDWEQRRYELAKAAMQGYCANPAYDDTFEKHAELSVEMADALIKKLKGE